MSYSWWMTWSGSAARRVGRYSQKWALSALEDVGEADRSIEQRLDCKHCPLSYPITLAGLLEMSNDGLVLDAQYPADLPVGFAAGDPQDALALAVGEPRLRLD